MRGKETIKRRMQAGRRITPAYAGKSHIFQFLTPAWWDHPRLCGEKLHMGLNFGFGWGITPAYAGKS